MLITEKLGTLDSFPGDRVIDHVWLNWFEANKRILNKKSTAGRDVQIKFLQGNPAFQPGDVIFVDGNTLGVIDITETDVLVIHPRNMHEMAAICYEIGNKHLPLFYQDEEIVVAYDNALFKYLGGAGFSVQKDIRKLTQALITTVAPHGAGNKSFFNRIMQLTTENG